MPYTPPDHSMPAPWEALQAARERAIALLTDRYADDSLSDAEFEARLEWLRSADSPARIEALVADLHVPRGPAAYADRATEGPVQEERLLAILSSSSRTGRWTVPPRLAVRAVMSDVKLDLRGAWLPPMGRIDLLVVMANVRIIIPPEVGVDCRITPIMGTVRNEAEETTWSAYGAPQLVLTGTCVMAEVRVEVQSRMR